MQPPVVLTIAANDPIGGAGLAADLATFSALGVHGAVVVTAVTAQRLGSVERVEWVDVELVAGQIESVVADLAPAAVKTGLLGSPQVVEVVAAEVEAGRLPAPVVDPVLVDGRGEPIVGADTVEAYRGLCARARVVTPNLAEARILAGVGPEAAVEEMAEPLAELGADLVVVTGGAAASGADDAVIARNGRVVWLRSARIETRNVRGSGCTFAAAVAAGLARGCDGANAVDLAHRFVREQLRLGADWAFDGGVGPVAHVRKEAS